MREALLERLHLIDLLGIERDRMIAACKPGSPTKMLEAVSLLKAGMKVMGDKLTDPEPTPVAPTEAQKLIVGTTNVRVINRARNLWQNIQKFEQVLVADHAAESVIEATDEQKQFFEEWLAQELVALKDAIDAL